MYFHLGRLRELEMNEENNLLQSRYIRRDLDPDLDTPSILKKFGNMYGIEFNQRVRFLLADGMPRFI